jgi:hypothetical protein
MQYTALRNGQKVLVTYRYEDFAECPTSTWDHTMPIIGCWHRRYNLGHSDGQSRIKELVREARAYSPDWEEKQFSTPSAGCYDNRHFLDLDDWSGLAAAAIKAGCIVLRVFLYDHSGLAVSLSNKHYPFNCPWDSGVVGIMVWSREQREAFHGKPILRDTKRRRERDTRIMESLFSEWACYLSGEVYEISVTDPQTQEILECCGGFHGWDYAQGDALRDFQIDPSTLNPLEAWQNRIN